MPLYASLGPPLWATRFYAMGQHTVKTAEAAPAYNLHGLLYLATDGWLRLTVPAPFVRGIFAAMHEPGIELPRSEDGRFEPNIGVMSKDEVDLIGADKITERGKSFAYTIGRLLKVDPEELPDVRSAWVIRVHSTALQALRRSYGLSSLPRNGDYDLHILCAVVRRGVLGRSEASKATEQA